MSKLTPGSPKRQFLVRQAKPGTGGCDVKQKPFIGTQRVANPARQSRPAAGSESCVVVGRPALRSVDSECAGRVIEPRNGVSAGADVVKKTEGSIGAPQMAWRVRSRRGRRAGHVHKGSPGTWEALPSPRHIPGWRYRVNNSRPSGAALGAAGAKHECHRGTAKRRKRSAAGRAAGIRSIS